MALNWILYVICILGALATTFSDPHLIVPGFLFSLGALLLLLCRGDSLLRLSVALTGGPAFAVILRLAKGTGDASGALPALMLGILALIGGVLRDRAVVKRGGERRST